MTFGGDFYCSSDIARFLRTRSGSVVGSGRPKVKLGHALVDFHESTPIRANFEYAVFAPVVF